jgi:thiamine pyrophosphate-dependent acetolactate synthase large subunit-like protein
LNLFHDKTNLPPSHLDRFDINWILFMNGGEIIVQQLKRRGVKFLFTLCGGHIAPIYVEAEKAGIKVIDVRDESTAVFAADAVSRLTSVPGVALVTAGPGITNSVTALKNAQLAQSPMLLIAGATPTLLHNRGALQDIDQVSIVQSSVKKTFSVSRLKHLGSIIQRAMSLAVEGVPGPVFVECPVDLLYDEAAVRDMYSSASAKTEKSFKEKITRWYINNHVNSMFKEAQKEFSDINIKSRVPPKSQISKLASLIKQSARPVMILGSGVMADPRHASALARAINDIGIPVYLSGMSRGLLGQHNPHHFHHNRKAALQKADLIILAGLPCDFRLNYGKGFSKNAKKITINLDKKHLSKNIAPYLAIHYNPASVIISLQHETVFHPSWDEWKKEFTDREESREKEITAMASIKGKYINAVALFQKLEQLLPVNSIIICDGGDFAATCSYIVRPRKPLSWLDSGAFGTLGVGAGFALGASLCNPGDYVFIIYGDGSAGYSIAEFDTFTKLGLNICAIIGNNGSWEQIAREQVVMLGADTATTLPRSDYQLVAKSFGANGERTEMLEDFERAIGCAIQSMDKGIPYLINAIIDSSAFRKGSISM